MSRTERLTAEDLLLHSVADNATLETVRSFALDIPALLHVQKSNGDTALHSAVQLNRAVPLICALLKEGVDPIVKNNAGQTPADMAREEGRALLATLLDRAAEDKRKRELLQQQNID